MTHNNLLLYTSLVHTKLYSFRFDCNIVSFTAAKTNRIFSVSKEKKTIRINIFNSIFYVNVHAKQIIKNYKNNSY